MQRKVCFQKPERPAAFPHAVSAGNSRRRAPAGRAWLSHPIKTVLPLPDLRCNPSSAAALKTPSRKERKGKKLSNRAVQPHAQVHQPLAGKGPRPQPAATRGGSGPRGGGEGGAGFHLERGRFAGMLRTPLPGHDTAPPPPCGARPADRRQDEELRLLRASNPPAPSRNLAPTRVEGEG